MSNKENQAMYLLDLLLYVWSMFFCFLDYDCLMSPFTARSKLDLTIYVRDGARIEDRGQDKVYL